MARNIDENQQCLMKPDVTEYPSEEEDLSLQSLIVRRNITKTTLITTIQVCAYIFILSAHQVFECSKGQ